MKAKQHFKKKLSLEQERDEVVFLQRLRKARMLVFQSQTIKELKFVLKNKLPDVCQVNSVSIQKKIPDKKNIFNVYLSFDADYVVCFQTDLNGKIDKKFLRKVAQSIDMSLFRIEKYNQVRLLKNQWKVAFNAIQKPICLTDHRFCILSSNNAFLQNTKKKKPDIYRQNCFSIFFNSPLNDLEKQKLRQSTILKSLHSNEQIFEVYCQSLNQQSEEESLYLIIFTDMTEKIKMQTQVNHTSDSAEMGIITSSIAHELNNPLSGMQSLLQIIEQDKVTNVKQKELSYVTDDMLQAILRCQQIVRQLLNLNSVQDLLEIAKLKKDKSLEVFF